MMAVWFVGMPIYRWRAGPAEKWGTVFKRYVAPTMLLGIVTGVSMTLAYVEGDVVMDVLSDKLIKEHVEPMKEEKFKELERMMPESYHK